MKKNWFYLFALICSVALFTACSDDEDTSWQQIPQTEITVGENATLTVNGTAATSGSVQLQVNDATSGVLTLNDVVPGYDGLEVDVTLEKQADNTFNFTGSADINTAPATKADVNSTPTVLTVEVEGTISLDGQVEVALTAYGSGLYVGTYSGEKLALTCGETPLAGKSVVFAFQGDVPVLTLVNVVPGEASVAISGVYVGEDGSFGGEATTVAGVSISYSGTVSMATGMSLDLTFAIPDPQGWAGTYSLADYVGQTVSWSGTEVANWPVQSAMYVDWISGDDYTQFMGALFRYLLGGCVLPQSLDNVILRADGYIQADYMETPAITLDPSSIMSIFFTGSFPVVDASTFPGSGFVTSPIGLATWQESDGQLLVKLNVSSILGAALGTDGGADLEALIMQLLQSDPATLKTLIGNLLQVDVTAISDATIQQLQSWVLNGIPMQVATTEDGHTHIYLDKSAFDTLFTANAEGNSDVMILWTALSDAGIIPEEAQAAAILLNMFNMYWPTTTTFNLGLDLVK